MLARCRKLATSPYGKDAVAELVGELSSGEANAITAGVEGASEQIDDAQFISGMEAGTD